MEVITSVHLNVVRGVADTVLDDGTELNTVFLLHSVEVNLFLEAEDPLVDVEAGPFDLGFDGASAFVVGNIMAPLHSLRVADLFFVVEALVLGDDLVLEVAVRAGLLVVVRYIG
jgi:hypothetical protein